MAAKTEMQRKVASKVRQMKKEFGEFKKADAITLSDLFERFAYNAIKCEEIELALEEEGEICVGPKGGTARNPKLAAYKIHLDSMRMLHSSIQKALKAQPSKDEKELLREFLSEGAGDDDYDFDEV